MLKPLLLYQCYGGGSIMPKGLLHCMEGKGGDIVNSITDVNVRLIECICRFYTSDNGYY